MRYCISRADLEPDPAEEDGVRVLHLFDAARGCTPFDQRVLRFSAGRSTDRVQQEADEVLYVLDGAGRATIGGTQYELGSGSGAFVGAGTAWSIATEEGIELLSVVVHDPESVPTSTGAVVDLGAGDRRDATASRQFLLGVTPDVGCRSVTQFIGFVPPGRAPDHFHRYDEVLYVLAGEGVLHIGGEQAAFAPGSCVHLPTRLVHALENTGARELELLGVFRPAGSPAEAYYPDGSPAAYPES